MSNSYFQFKQFKINQERTAMKVGTDGVLLGAWANCGDACSILDVGTGTGLLALMLAQRSQAKITAIEIDEEAALQAIDNVEASPWRDRIEILHADFKIFSSQTAMQFDLIVSNPPYFQNSFKAKGSSRTIARHTDSLQYAALAKGASNLLTPSGRFSVIIPADAFTLFEKICADFFLHLVKKVNVIPTPNKNAKRVLLEFSKNKPNDIEIRELVIETGERHQYSDAFIELVKPFYLHL